jgi:hypothetical protein
MPSDIDLDWRVLPPGPHDAIICDVDFFDGRCTDIIFEYRVRHGGDDYRLRESLPVDAPKDSADYARTAAGHGRLHKLYRILGEAAPKEQDRGAISRALLGLAVRIQVKHKIVEGLASPKVTAVLGGAANPVPPPLNGKGP